MYLINLWYALNSNEKIVRIEDAKKGEKYFCPCCGAEVLPRALDSTKVEPHFYHRKGESCSKNGGENWIHKWIKTVLFCVGQSFKVNTCKGIKEYVVKDVLIEETYKTSVGDYRPDISVITEDGVRLFIEICNTNKKRIEKYWGKWFELGNTVIEVKTKDIIDNNFNLGILEPIYEDGDRFGRFEESDYIGLFGVIDEDKKNKLEVLYNSIYDLIHYNAPVNTVLYALSDMTDDFYRYSSPSETMYKIIDRHVCDYAKEIFFNKYNEYYNDMVNRAKDYYDDYRHYIENISPCGNSSLDLKINKSPLEYEEIEVNIGLYLDYKNFGVRYYYIEINLLDGSIKPSSYIMYCKMLYEYFLNYHTIDYLLSNVFIEEIKKVATASKYDEILKGIRCKEFLQWVTEAYELDDETIKMINEKSSNLTYENIKDICNIKIICKECKKEVNLYDEYSNGCNDITIRDNDDNYNVFKLSNLHLCPKCLKIKILNNSMLDADIKTDKKEFKIGDRIDMTLILVNQNNWENKYGNQADYYFLSNDYKDYEFYWCTYDHGIWNSSINLIRATIDDIDGNKITLTRGTIKEYLKQGYTKEELDKIGFDVFNYESEVNNMEDKKIVCKDCGKEFVFTVGEQEFFKDKGYDHEPKRCISCRRKRRQTRKEKKE